MLHPTKLLLSSSSLYVPNVPFNLLYVNKLPKNLNFTAIFYTNSCIFQDLTTKKMLGLGCEKDGLYHLDLSEPTSSILSAIFLPSSMTFSFRSSIFSKVVFNYTHIESCV